MIKAIRRFFAQQFAPDEDGDSEQDLRLATAALLMEMGRADFEHSAEERGVIEQRLREHFQLDPEQSRALARLAVDETEAAVSLHRFTAMLNEQLAVEEREAILTLAWEVAFADGVLDRHEDAYARKLSDLLHLRHSEFIRAKHTAMHRLGLDPDQTP